MVITRQCVRLATAGLRLDDDAELKTHVPSVINSGNLPEFVPHVGYS